MFFEGESLTLRALSESKLVESKNSFDDERFKKIGKEFNELRNRFSKPQIKEIRRNLYGIKNPNNLLTQKIKEIKKDIFGLEQCFSNFKKYCSQDDSKHKNLRDIINSIDEDY